jgi:hypothetical protein
MNEKTRLKLNKKTDLKLKSSFWAQVFFSSPPRTLRVLALSAVTCALTSSPSMGSPGNVLLRVSSTVSPLEEPKTWEQAQVQYLFIPQGFDDNDDVELVIDGYLPNSCYKIMDPIVAIDMGTQTVEIEPRSRYSEPSNSVCLEALIPYFLTVRLGNLPKGDYFVRVNQSSLDHVSDLGAKLTILSAKSPSQDNALYAPVDSAQVHRDEDGQQYIQVEGRLTNSCMEFDEILLEDHGPTLNLLPKIRMRTASRDQPCVAQEGFYFKKIRLPETLHPGRHLLHVRSLNGIAVNVLFYVRPWN